MSTINSAQLASSFLHSVQSGTYPETDEVASCNLSTESLPAVLAALTQGRADIQNEIRQISNNEASNVDGWILQAQQLQTDIERSKSIASEIAREADELRSLHTSRRDVSAKLDLLRIEAEFNRKLKDNLAQIQRTTKSLAAGQEAADRGDIAVAEQNCHDTSRSLEQFDSFRDTIALDLLEQRYKKLRQTLIEHIDEHWQKSLLVDSDNSRIVFTISQTSAYSLESLVESMIQLNIFEARITTFCRDFDRLIMRPCLRRFSDGRVSEIHINDNDIRIGDKISDPGSIIRIDKLALLLHFLHLKLPTIICSHLSEILMPNTISTLITSWLSRSVATSLNMLPDYERVLERVQKFADELRALDFQGDSDLVEWVEDSPKIWLAKRRESSLVFVRDAISQGLRKTKIVERVETQMVAPNDVIVSSETLEDEWESGWSNAEQTEYSPREQDLTKNVEEEQNEEGEIEDLSAWDEGIEEPRDDAKSAIESEISPERTNDDDDEAWDWDDRGTTSPEAIAATHLEAQAQINGHDSENQPEERQLTLKETYTVTFVPENVLEIISEVINDAQSLGAPSYLNSAIAPAATGLFSLPQLVLAGFRALAATYYTPISGGNMYLYNDCVRLVSELKELIHHSSSLDRNMELQKSAWLSARKKLASDVETLSTFGKRAYGKEMQSQRTILRDLLDGAQGFVNCSEAPFSSECENAVAMTSDRIREVYKQWTPILSRSALLQSMGSLLAAVLDKVLVDICDLSDISESESTRLRHFCIEISKLSDLFTQENPNGGTTDMTGVYAPNWFKFQYLGEILESSLADIKFLWSEGELSLEFGPDEVVDLVEALFAESDHRRKAISEIQRT